MVKQIIAIDVHSFVDVITNSSTELFVCDTDKTIEAVEEILHKLIDHYNELVELAGNHVEKLDYDEVFDTPYIYTKEMWYNNKSDEYKWNYHDEKNIGRIIISGVDDNSIPYEMFDKIENLFNGYREHLG